MDRFALIKLIITGGTIAKKYNELNGELEFDEHHLCKMLDQARCSVELNVKQLFLKDSLDMDDSDRELLLQEVLDSKEDKIIITHGTDTMTKSADKLSSIKDKTIIFTGAMIPFAFKKSDALFNLGTAFGAIEILPSGLYVAMNGRIFRSGSVIKDKKLGKFITKN